MCQSTTWKIYKGLINQGVNSNCNTVVAGILFKQFNALKHVLHTDMFAYLAKTLCKVCYIYWPIHFK